MKGCFIGPMSLNVVDCVIDGSTSFPVGLIPSRRQVDSNGGYVNGWNTKTFSEYVRSRSSNVMLCRDHGGPNQGSSIDDGVDSIKNDAFFLDLIHIDPFKSTKSMEEASKLTVRLIEQTSSLNSSVLYEVGTEESIFKYEPDDLRKLLETLETSLRNDQFERIRYAVVQSGTGLDLANCRNTGTFNQDRLERFVKVCRDFQVSSKEHNGDYLIENQLLDQRFGVGLDAINIAPEFGQIETEWYLQACKFESEKLYDQLFSICYNSNRWSKWVSSHNRDTLTKDSYIRMSCHYLLSDSEFVSQIKSEFPTADLQVRDRINHRLELLREQTKDYCIRPG